MLYATVFPSTFYAQIPYEGLQTKILIPLFVLAVANSYQSEASGIGS